MENSGLMITRIQSAVFRHRRLLLSLFFGTMILTIGVTLLMPKQYESTMKIVVQNIRESETVGADKGNGQQEQASSQDVIDSRVNGEVELLSSTDLMEHLVNYRAKVLSDAPNPAAGSTDLAKEVRKLNKRLTVDPVRKSTVIDVSYLDNTPESAQKVLQELERSYIDKHVHLRRPAGTYQFFDSETEAYSKKLTAAENELAQFQKDNGFISLDKEKQTLGDSINSVKSELNSDQADISGSQSKINTLRRSIASLPERVTTSVRDSPSQYAVQLLTSTLVDLQNRRTQLLTRYQPSDKLVKETEAQIATTTKSLDQLKHDHSLETSTDNNPVRLALDQQLKTEEVLQAATIARMRELQKQAGVYQARFDHLQAITARNNELERTVQELRDNQHNFADKRDSAKIEDKLDQERFGNVSIAMEPTFSQQHAKPRFLMNVAFGFITAVFLCVAAIMVLESTRQTFLTPAELEAGSDVPVLATIPEVHDIDSIFALDTPKQSNALTISSSRVSIS